MSKIGRNKKKCEHYRTSGHLQTNKLLKQECNEKRIAKFATRREAGKSYEYKPNPYAKGTKEYINEARRRSEKSVDMKLPLQKITSIMRKLDNKLAKERAEKKVWKERKKAQELEVV